MSENTELVVDYEERFIWLDGEINQEIAYKFKRMLDKLNKKLFPIIFYIKGPGGNPHSAFFMMNEIQSSKSPVATIAHGFVNSGCFLLTQAGVRRLALAGTKFTFHPADGCFVGNSRGVVKLSQGELLESLQRLRLIDSIQLSWFLKKGRPTKKIFDLFVEQTMLTLPEAQRLNLIDGYYKTEDFLKDLKIARKLIKAK